MFPIRSNSMGNVLLSDPVNARLACRFCSHKGQYRLVRLAAKYGSEVEMCVLQQYRAGDRAYYVQRTRIDQEAVHISVIWNRIDPACMAPLIYRPRRNSL